MAAMKPVQFMPPGIVRTMFDRKHGGPGNWFIAVNGLYVPTERVMTNLPEPDIDRVRLDAREPSIASYPVIGNKEYFIEFDVPSYQALYEEFIYGKEIVDYATTNLRRHVGSHVTPAATADAEWFVLRLDTSICSDSWAVIPRFDFQGHDATSLELYHYNPATEGVSSAGTEFDSYEGINGKWLGKVRLEGDTQDFDYFSYDSHAPTVVSFGSDQLVIDPRHIDPTLSDGDRAVIIGVQYDFLQLSGENSYSFQWNMFEADEVPIDMYMAMGPSLKTSVMLSRHIQRAQLVNIPDFGETAGDRQEHNRRTFRFEILQVEPQAVNAKAIVSDLFEESYHIL